MRHLYGLFDELNDTETQMIGMKPKNVIKLNQVHLVNQENYPPEDTLPEDGLYHDAEQLIGYGLRRLTEIVKDLGNHVMYYLKDGPESAFILEELMLIPEDTELAPDYVQHW